MDFFGNFYNVRTYSFNDIFGKCLEISKHILPMIFLETLEKSKHIIGKMLKTFMQFFYGSL